MIWCLLRLPYRSCLLQRPNFKTYGKNYTRFKLYHLSSKHKIICNRNYFSSEALLVLYLPLVCFRLGSLLTGAGHGSQATKWRHATCIYETKNNTLPLVCTSYSTPFCCPRKWESILWTGYLLGHRTKRNAWESASAKASKTWDPRNPWLLACPVLID